MTTGPCYDVDGERVYLRRCSWGEEWRVLMPIGYRVTLDYDATFASQPIRLRIRDGERWHEQTWWWPGFIGDLP